jgi:hypothetical protein
MACFQDGRAQTPWSGCRKLELENTRMKPLTIAIIGALVVAVAVVGYLYYQRTSNDVVIQLPKVELKP